MLANLYCIKYLEELNENTHNTYTFVALPDNISRWNGSKCDMLIGPCTCGAWHNEKEIPDARLTYINNSSNVRK